MSWKYSAKAPKRSAFKKVATKKRSAPSSALTKHSTTKKITKNLIGRDAIMYKSPSMKPLPSQYFSKFRCRIAGALAAAAGFFSAAGLAKTYILINSMPTQLNHFAGTAGVSLLTGVSATPQAVGFQTLCNSTAYYTYQVLRSKVTVKLMPQAATDDIYVALTPSSTSTQPVNIGDALAAPWTKRSVCSYPTSTDYKNTVTNDCPIAQFLGMPAEVYNSDQSQMWTANYNAAPTNGMYMSIVFQTTNGSEPVSAVPFEIDIESDVRLFGLDNAELK